MTALKGTKLLLDESNGSFLTIIDVWNHYTNSCLVLVSDHCESDQLLIISDREEAVITALFLAQSNPNFREKPIYWLLPSTRSLTRHKSTEDILSQINKTTKIRSNEALNFLGVLLG